MKYIGLYRSTLKPVEVFADYITYRPLAFPLVLLFQKLKISPNAVSITALVFFAASAACFILHWPLLAALCIFFGTLLDFADGQLARITGSSSPLGAKLDYFGDIAGTILFFGAIVYVQVSASGNYLIILYAVLSLLLTGFNISLFEDLRRRYISRYVRREAAEVKVKGPAAPGRSSAAEKPAGSGARASGLEPAASTDKAQAKAPGKFGGIKSFLAFIAPRFEAFQQAVFYIIAPLPDTSVPGEQDGGANKEQSGREARFKAEEAKFSLTLKLWSFISGTTHRNLLIILCLFNRLDLLWIFCILYFNLFVAALSLVQWALVRKPRAGFSFGFAAASAKVQVKRTGNKTSPGCK